MPFSPCKQLRSLSMLPGTQRRTASRSGALGAPDDSADRRMAMLPIVSMNECTRARMLVFFNDTATTEISALSLHDALPISPYRIRLSGPGGGLGAYGVPGCARSRSEEHTSELQSPCNLVCRLLLEQKK